MEFRSCPRSILGLITGDMKRMFVGGSDWFGNSGGQVDTKGAVTMDDMSVGDNVRCYGVLLILFFSTLLALKGLAVTQTVHSVSNQAAETTPVVSVGVPTSTTGTTVSQLVSTEVRSASMSLAQAIQVAVASPSAPDVAVQPINSERLEVVCTGEVGVGYVLEVLSDLRNWEQKGVTYPSTTAVKFQVDLLNAQVVSYYRIQAVTPSETTGSGSTVGPIDTTWPEPVITGITGGGGR